MEKRYRLNASRTVNLWFLPVFFLILTLFMFFMKNGSVSQAPTIDIIGFTLFLIFVVGIFMFLFFNHLPLANRTEIIVKGKQFLIIQNGKEDSTNFDDITKIEEYTANRLPWGRIVKWCLTANDKTYTISSLTIAQLNFERYFYNKTVSRTTLFPTI